MYMLTQNYQIFKKSLRRFLFYSQSILIVELNINAF
jgi:hypothetical protein